MDSLDQIAALNTQEQGPEQSMRIAALGGLMIWLGAQNAPDQVYEMLAVILGNMKNSPTKEEVEEFCRAAFASARSQP